MEAPSSIALCNGETCAYGGGSKRRQRVVKKSHSDLLGESADAPLNRESFLRKTFRPTYWFQRRQRVMFVRA
jgi:hypothetical protein